MLHRRISLPVAAVLTLAACSGGSGSDDALPPVSEATPVTVAPADPAPVNEDATTTVPPADDPVVTEAPSDTAPSAAQPTYAELASELAPAPTVDDETRDQTVDTDGDIQLALADFAVRFGAVPGARDFVVDDTFPEEASEAVEILESNWDSLTGEQQNAITDGLDRFRAESTPIYTSADDPEYAAVLAELGGVPSPGPIEALTVAESDAEGFARPTGFRSQSVTLALPNVLTLERIASDVTRILQRQLGGMPLDIDMLSAPPDRTRNGFTRTLTRGAIVEGDPECTIWIFDNAALNDRDVLVSTIAHEVFHCWVYTNAADLTTAGRAAPFYNEGLATWVGEAIAGGSDYGRAWFGRYLEPTTYPLFNESYSAHGFWSEIAQLRGNDAQLMAIIPELVAGSPRGASNIFLVATSGLADEQVALLAARSLNRPEFGSNWTASGSNVPAASRPTQEFSLVPLGLESTLASRGQQVIAQFAFDELPDDETWVITHRASGLTHNRWSNGDEFTTTADTEERFCLGDECVCPDGSALPFDVSALPGGSLSIHTALTGGADSSSTISMFATSLDDVCDEEEEVPQPTGGQPGDLIGTWRASGEVVQQMFQEFYGDSLLLTDVAGSIFLTLGADGGGSLKYADVTLIFGDVTPPVTISGGGTIAWNASDGELRITDTDFAVQATSPAIGDIPLELSDDDLPSGGVTSFQVAVDDQVMTLLSPEGTLGWLVVFPRRFIRQ